MSFAATDRGASKSANDHPAPQAQPRWRTGLIAAIALVLMLLCIGWYRHSTSQGWQHPDQIIPIQVIRAMDARGNLDTDWAKADLPEHFREMRYNFSGYILVTYAVTAMDGDIASMSDARIEKQSRRLSRIFASFTVALVFVLIAWRCNIPVALAAAIATAVTPQLVQDANFVRPEALSTFCFTLCFAMSQWSIRMRHPLVAVAAIAAIAGFLASVKFTYAISVLFVLPGVFLAHGRGRQIVTSRMTTWLLLCAICFAAGFLLGAPYVVADFSGYLAGLEALNQQYGGGHPPHGRIGGGPVAMKELMGGYYFGTLGLGLLALHPVGYAGRSLAPAKFVYLGILLITLAAFLTQDVFFERNFSLLIPAFLCISAIALENLAQWISRSLPIRHAGTLAGGAACIVFAIAAVRPISVSLKLVPLPGQPGLEADSAQRLLTLRQIADAQAARRIVEVPFGEIHALQYPRKRPACLLYRAMTYNDDWSSRYFRDMPSRFKVVAVIPSPFADIPVSTLQVYHRASDYLFIDTQACNSNAHKNS